MSLDVAGMVNSTPWYEWVFSGAGVAGVSLLVAKLYQHFRKTNKAETSSFVQVSASTVQGPVAGRDVNIETYIQQSQGQPFHEHRPVPTLNQIATSISEATPYLRQTVAGSYAGMKIHWKMQIDDLRFIRDQVDLTLKSTESVGPYVVAQVSLADYPILKIFRGGEPADVVGTILWVQPENGVVHLTDVTLRIPK